MVFDQQYIVKPQERNTSLYNVVRGSIKPIRLLQSSLLHGLLLCSCKPYVQHIDTSFSHASSRRYRYKYNSNNVCCWRCFTWKNVLCHILCLYAEYSVSCGNKFLLNWKFWIELCSTFEVIETKWRIYVKMSYIITDSENGLSPVRWQSII